MKIVFLGTGAMQPTKERNLSAIYLNYESEHILFDCGEGTQRQMKIAGITPTKLTRVIISHFHADHVLGLGGLLRNLEANNYNKTLYLYGPKGLEKFFNNIINSAYHILNIKVKLIEINSGIIIDEQKFSIGAVPLKHSVPSYGFRFEEKPKRKINLEYLSKFGLKQDPILGELQRGKDISWKGKKITVKKATKLVKGKIVGLIFDTGVDKNCFKVAEDADLLIAESTFSEKEKEKAREYKHLTSADAAAIAKKSKSKKLILTHFSQRYKDVSELKKEAQKIFPNTTAAEDFLEVEV